MMLFDDRFADTPIGTLSGGERNRVQLARLLRKGGNLLILDEPTNDLDLPTLGVLEEALVEFPGCALIVSHDRWFLDRTATAILAFERQPDGTAKVTLHEGTFTAYLERTAQIGVGRSAAPKTPQGKPGKVTPTVTTPPKPKAKLSFKEQKELDGLQPAIEMAEADVVRLEAELADPALYKDRRADVPKVTESLRVARSEVERLYARWTELEARRG
jgi:ATP-binding cassette subfamily F protein uup